eukprot:g30883.t1
MSAVLKGSIGETSMAEERVEKPLGRLYHSDTPAMRIQRLKEEQRQQRQGTAPAPPRQAQLEAHLPPPANLMKLSEGAAGDVEVKKRKLDEKKLKTEKKKDKKKKDKKKEKKCKATRLNNRRCPQVYGVVPDPPSQGEPTRSEVWQYKRVICLATLISALYNDLPKVLLCIWLLPTNESLESWFLRIAIVAINGLYVLWALLLSFWTFFEPMPEGHALVQISLKDAAVEVWEESVEVRWSYPRKKQTATWSPIDGMDMSCPIKDRYTEVYTEDCSWVAPVPDEFICAVQPLGEPQPSLVRRVRHDGSDLSCTFGALQPDYPYSVLLAPAHRGVLLGRPLRIACRTLPRALPLEPESLCLRRCGPSWAEISWTGAQGTAAAPPMEPRHASLGKNTFFGGLPAIHQRNTSPMAFSSSLRYQVGLKLPHDPREPALRLSFVTALEEDEAVSGVMTSLTTLRKDLAEIKRTRGSRSVVRQLGTLQERWAGLQVSCLTGEVQKLVESNEELKKDQILQR